MRRDGIRLGLGVAALGLLGLAAWTMLGEENPAVAGVAARSGILLGAAWFAYPALRRASWRSALGWALAVIVVVARPRAAVVVLPVAALVLAGVRRG